MKSKNETAQRICVSTQKAIAMALVRLMVVSAPHTGAQDFVRCTTSEGKLRERLAKQLRGSCWDIPLRNAFGQRSTRTALFQNVGPIWVGAGNGPPLFSKARIVAMECWLSMVKTEARIGWPMNLRLDRFLKTWNLTIFVGTVNVSTPRIWSLLLPEKTCFGEKACKPKTLERRIAIKGTLYPGIISNQIQGWGGEFVGSAQTQTLGPTENVFGKKKMVTVESVSVSAPAATGADSATLRRN